jgi:hypothetical protein
MIRICEWNLYGTSVAQAEESAEKVRVALALLAVRPT